MTLDWLLSALAILGCLQGVWKMDARRSFWVSVKKWNLHFRPLGPQKRPKYTFGKYIFEKYPFGKYTFRKYTFGKYTFGKYTFRKYTYRKYTYIKYIFREYTFGKYMVWCGVELMILNVKPVKYVKLSNE